MEPYGALQRLLKGIPPEHKKILESMIAYLKAASWRSDAKSCGGSMFAGHSRAQAIQGSGRITQSKTVATCSLYLKKYLPCILCEGCIRRSRAL